MTALTQIAADAALRTYEVIPPHKKDLQALGFASFADYRLWCLRNGWEDGLGRSEAERRAALQATGETAPHDTQERREVIRQTVVGEVDWRPDTYKWIEGNEEVTQALLRLMLHVNRYMNVLHLKKLSKGGRHRDLICGLVAVAYHHRRWIRPLEEWSTLLPKGGHPRREEQFSSLVRHLFARYEIPEFMDSAWFEGVDERGLKQQEWFMHIANGGSMRDLDTPIQLTRRMADLYMRTSNRGTIEKNMRWAQVIAMGGSRALASAILKTRLGRRFDNDEFWSGVVLFLANNAMMDPTWAGPLVDYVHNMKFAPRRIVQEGGGVEDGPPQQPNFTMKGRSAHKILRQVEAWHGELGREKYVDFQSWQACGLRPWELTDETEKLGKVRWTVQELLSSWELAAEGRAMSHCVVSYSDQCADGNTAVWSICAHREGTEEREHVLTVALDIKARAVTQARGRHNAVPNKRQKTAQIQRLEEGGYIRLLDRSAYVLQEWMQRERLRREI